MYEVKYLEWAVTQNVEDIHYGELLKNPLSPELFPQQCKFVYAQHMPCSQVLLSHSVHSPGARLGGTSTWRAPSGNAINDIHNHQGAKQLEVKVDIELILMQDLP